MEKPESVVCPGHFPSSSSVTPVTQQDGFAHSYWTRTKTNADSQPCKREGGHPPEETKNQGRQQERKGGGRLSACEPQAEGRPRAGSDSAPQNGHGPPLPTERPRSPRFPPLDRRPEPSARPHLLSPGSRLLGGGARQTRWLCYRLAFLPPPLGRWFGIWATVLSQLLRH